MNSFRLNSKTRHYGQFMYCNNNNMLLLYFSIFIWKKAPGRSTKCLSLDRLNPQFNTQPYHLIHHFLSQAVIPLCCRCLVKLWTKHSPYTLHCLTKGRKLILLLLLYQTLHITVQFFIVEGAYVSKTGKKRLLSYPVENDDNCIGLLFDLRCKWKCRVGN